MKKTQTLKNENGFYANSPEGEHFELINSINILQKANMQKKYSPSLIAEILIKLSGYAVTQFGDEEKLFHKHKYMFFKEHKKEHDDFIIVLEGYHKRLVKDSHTLGKELLSFINEWFVSHIQVSDKAYSKFHLQNKI